MSESPQNPITADSFAGNERFAVVRRLGAGSLGVVYEAHDRTLDRRVALKALSTRIAIDNLRSKSTAKPTQRRNEGEVLKFDTGFVSLDGEARTNLVAFTFVNDFVVGILRCAKPVTYGLDTHAPDAPFAF